MLPFSEQDHLQTSLPFHATLNIPLWFLLRERPGKISTEIYSLDKKHYTDHLQYLLSGTPK